MNTDIPLIECTSNRFKKDGIKILSIADLKNSDKSERYERPHRLDFYMFVFYTEGKSKHLVDFNWHDINRNTLVYLTPGQINAFSFDNESKGFVIIFTKDYLKKQLSRIPKDAMICLFTPHLFRSAFYIPEKSNTESYIQLLFNEYNTDEPDTNNDHIVDSLYVIIFSKIEQLKTLNALYPKETDKLDIFLEFLHILETDFSKSRNADYYAKKLNITYQQLNLICKEIVNSSAKQFIDVFIITEAKRKLVNSNIKSSELAFSMGFEESTNFIKYFKKNTRLTPNQFKKRYSE
ncbi:helix-turn-helix domain-containing protein [Marinifilum flexuosum]|uniref:helix-turn-helix domain-containing protein n=1 Tax=Marinifilum flexuosum TaxID=1117708 RepID=UPI002493BB8A|nr:helix-turn-helix transcriptional regulator [Marinifilum flexuosum]